MNFLDEFPSERKHYYTPKSKVFREIRRKPIAIPKNREPFVIEFYQKLYDKMMTMMDFCREYLKVSEYINFCNYLKNPNSLSKNISVYAGAIKKFMEEK